MTVLSTLSDAGRVGKDVVVLDVFRSSNTILALLDAGADRVVPVEEVDEALRLKRENPDWIVLGERKGVKLPGFDGDNSPLVDAGAVRGRSVAITTSGGTRVIAAAAEREARVWIGSFANATALIAALCAAGADAPAFWAVGQAGETPAEEDEICAACLDDLWHGRAVATADLEARLRATAGADRLRELGQQADLDWCCALDTHRIVPRLEGHRGFILSPISGMTAT